MGEAEITMDGARASELTTTAEEHVRRATPDVPPIWSLQLQKAERLNDLLRCRPGQKHYKRALRAYLDADRSLQKAFIERFGLETVF
jgi:hypothetical protein